jgi:hypothetical protein
VSEANKHASILYQAFQVGRASGKIVAYHGTSIDVLRTIYQTGKQVGSDNERKNQQIHLSIRKGDVFVFPINGRTDKTLVQTPFSEADAFMAAGCYAELITAAHFLARRLGINKYIEHYSDISALSDLVLEYNPNLPIEDQNNPGNIADAARVVEQAGFSLQQMRPLIKEAMDKRGVVIGYSEAALRNGDPLPGNDEGHDVRIQGANIDSIIGLEPLDDEVFNFLEGLMGHSRDSP